MSSHKYVLLDFVYCSDGSGKIRKLEQSEFVDVPITKPALWLLTKPKELKELFIPGNAWGNHQFIVCWSDGLPKDTAYFKNAENDENNDLMCIHKLVDFIAPNQKTEFLAVLDDLAIAFIHRKSVYEDAGKTFTQYFIGLRSFT